MKTVFRYLKEYSGRMTVGFIIKVLGTAAELMLPLILSHILKNVITRSEKDIIFWGCIMILFSAMACVCNIAANRSAAKVSKDFAGKIRTDLFAATLKFSASQTDRYTIPSLESRITTDTYNVHQFVNMAQRLGVRAPIMLVGGIAITLFMDARLSLVMIALLPLIFAVIYFLRIKGIPLYTKVQKSTDDMISVVREDTGGMRVIKALSKTEFEQARYDRENKKLVSDELRAGTVMSGINPAMNFFMNIGSIAVIALGSFYVSKGLSDPETIIAFMQYFTLISTAMISVTRIFVMYTKCAASAGRIEEVLLEKEDIKVFAKEEYPDEKTDAHIVFDHVNFSYNGRKENACDISFSVKKGEKLGIIGPTGSGKSTVIRLLMRFYDVGSGRILIDGEDIRTIEKDRLYSMFGTALQNDFLYSDTIEENISFGRNIPHEKIVKATDIAQATDFITDFSDGYGHMLSPHGTNISGGQKQRVLISRAIAGEPDILILDDSSSALDYKTDAMLRRALSENMKDTTVITVAQRVSSVKDCDLILVFEKGKIIGAGKHGELLSTCGEYREISDSQMGGAFVE